jgi:hypothetical protein
MNDVDFLAQERFCSRLSVRTIVTARCSLTPLFAGLGFTGKIGGHPAPVRR